MKMPRPAKPDLPKTEYMYTVYATSTIGPKMSFLRKFFEYLKRTDDGVFPIDLDSLRMWIYKLADEEFMTRQALQNHVITVLDHCCLLNRWKRRFIPEPR